MIAFVAIGILAGTLSFAVALSLGASFWFALLLYSLIGAASVLGAALVFVFRGKRTERDSDGWQDVSFPADAGPSVPEPDLPAAYLTQRGMRILAVDDDPIILGLIPRIAAEIGCADTTISSSGAQALSFLEQSSRPFDCLLLDINMPGMDGIELCGRIRRIPAYRDTPIIMLTAMQDFDFLDRAFRAGASDYITKPFDVIAFGTCLRNVQDKILLTQVDTVVADSDGGIGDAGWDVPTPGSIAGVASLIEHAALQNYLVRLSGVALSRAYVMAVEVHHSAGSADAPVALAPVVVALDTLFTKQPCVMSYIGEGRFILVSSGVNLPDPAGLERAIEDQLHGQAGYGDAIPDSGVTVYVGPAVRPGRDRTHRAQTAIENALFASGHPPVASKGVARG
ncbi:response regulator [Pseudotabrizicola sp. 4114]|uniref:response regulator n=1 Tax=Pseudotabrizicola sp. 4114 TaxID=2817731 RepID=UPI002863BD16|nr:CheY-like chemotaxis protein [Pseudorhodobacter sp. 4114]